jgi:hypothetical protein
MSKEMILMLHPTFGVLGLVTAVWAFAETLNASDSNVGRIRTAGVLTAVLIWLAYIVGGYFYVLYYGADKAIIMAGPWKYSHAFFMETKEHAFFMVLLLATFLAIAVQANVARIAGARRLVLYTSGLVVLMTLAMEGAGAMISMGVKVALLAKQAS